MRTGAPICAADRAARCDVEGLDPRSAVQGHGAAPPIAAPIQSTVTVVAGDNKVRMPCHRQKQIEGVLRTPDDEPPGRVIVRCPDGTNDRTHVRDARCSGSSARATRPRSNIRSATSGIWRRAPIASAADPAFVDIGL